MITNRKNLAILLLMLAAIRLVAADLSPGEIKRRDRNAKFDKQHLRLKHDFVTDSSPNFTTPPAKPAVAGNWTTARKAPTVHLRILPNLEPEYFPATAQYMACWANWAPILRGPDNTFYFAASDHRGQGCQINIYRYAHKERQLSRIIDLHQLLDWQPDSYTDGKVHGAMAIMPDGHLLGATHYGVPPTAAWYEAGYQGSWLFSFDLTTNTGRNFGSPLKRSSLPCFTIDPQRGIFVGTGDSKTLLCWDYNTGQTLFAGYLPHGWIWWQRAMLLDQPSGKFWSSDVSETPFHLLSFNPSTLSFNRYDITVPTNPVTAKPGNLRGHTTRPAANGYYYWATMSGALLRFKTDSPTGPILEAVGVTWDRGRDVLQIALSPDGRYLYYQPKGYPSPLVQFDTKTNQHKAICFLQDYYFEKYGYWLGSEVYGLEISEKGDFIAMIVNGAFDGHNRSFGHPGLCIVEIPRNER